MNSAKKIYKQDEIKREEVMKAIEILKNDLTAARLDGIAAEMLKYG